MLRLGNCEPINIKHFWIESVGHVLRHIQIAAAPPAHGVPCIIGQGVYACNVVATSLLGAASSLDNVALHGYHCLIDVSTKQLYQVT